MLAALELLERMAVPNFSSPQEAWLSQKLLLLQKQRVADCSSFSLHVAVRIGAGQNAFSDLGTFVVS